MDAEAARGPRLPLRAERSARRLLRHLATAPSARVRRGPGWLAVASGVAGNDLNGVVSDAGAVVDVGTVADLLAWFTDLAVPACWLLESPDPDLVDVLVGLGAVPERTGWWMGRELAGLDPPEALAPVAGVLVRPVETAAALEAWLDVAAACGWVVEGDGGSDRSARSTLMSDLLGSTSWRHLVATRDGEPVGMASVFHSGEVVDLCNLAVLPGSRRRGIGRLLVAHRVAEGRARGARSAVTAASPDGAELFRPLGFEAVRVRPDVCCYLPDPRPERDDVLAGGSQTT